MRIEVPVETLVYYVRHHPILDPFFQQRRHRVKLPEVERLSHEDLVGKALGSQVAPFDGDLNILELLGSQAAANDQRVEALRTQKFQVVDSTKSGVVRA